MMNEFTRFGDYFLHLARIRGEMNRGGGDRYSGVSGGDLVGQSLLGYPYGSLRCFPENPRLLSSDRAVCTVAHHI